MGNELVMFGEAFQLKGTGILQLAVHGNHRDHAAKEEAQTGLFNALLAWNDHHPLRISRSKSTGCVMSIKPVAGSVHPVMSMHLQYTNPLQHWCVFPGSSIILAFW